MTLKGDAKFVCSLLAFIVLMVLFLVAHLPRALEGPFAAVAGIWVGSLLRIKESIRSNVPGVQQVILSCLLPALLYRAIVNLPKATGEEVRFPAVALAYNLFLALCIKVFLHSLGRSYASKDAHTLILMFPGLAPGLTAFPYLTMYVATIPGSSIGVGQGGLADTGNKAFLLVIEYAIAQWLAACSTREGQSRSEPAAEEASGAKALIRQGSWQHSTCQLLRGFLGEPVNIALVLSVVVWLLGPLPLDEESVWGVLVGNLAACCVPVTLLFIGLKTTTPDKSQAALWALVVCRSGLGLLFAWGLRASLGIGIDEVMFWVFFCNSSTSLWSFFHVARITAAEKAAMEGLPDDRPRRWEMTFNEPLGLKILAISFQWTVVANTLFTTIPVEVWAMPPVLPGIGGGFAVLGAAGLLLPCFAARDDSVAKQNQSSAGAMEQEHREAAVMV